tara:strand:+ start:197 stop:1012 length:816 start_codon:yes stop_codon:yes gene_type:complete
MSDSVDDLGAEFSFNLPPTDFANQQMSYDLGGFLETLYICSHQPEVAREQHSAEFVSEMQQVDISLANYCRTRLAGSIAAIEIPLMATLQMGGDFMFRSPFFHVPQIIHQRILYGYWRQNLSGSDADYETNQTLLARLEELQITPRVWSRDKFYREMYRFRTGGYYDGGDNRLLDDGRQQYIKPTRKATREWRISCIGYVLGIGRVEHTELIGGDMGQMGRVIGRELASYADLIAHEFNTGQRYADFNFHNVAAATESWDNVQAFDPHHML